MHGERTPESAAYGRSSILVAVILGLALIACSAIVARSVARLRSSRQVIRVTGSARKAIRSDFIVWRGKVSERAATVAQAYARLKADGDRVRAYLVAKGVAPKEIYPLAIETTPVYARPAGGYPTPDDASVYREVVGYRLSQGLEVRSKAVDRVERIARESTEMIQSGIPIESMPPQYIHLGLGSLKLSMLADAAEDARERAKRIADSTGCRVGPLRYADMGVMQIVGLYGEEGITDTGANDTSSLDKRITAIVHAEFAIR